MAITDLTGNDFSMLINFARTLSENGIQASATVAWTIRKGCFGKRPPKVEVTNSNDRTSPWCVFNLIVPEYVSLTSDDDGGSKC